ncbi:MAG: UDP-glucose 4-epimerase, partial [Tissierellia bacterium]|nr:UDP-glucose 4-epimerase [Tissierellia bacterium]
YKTDDGTCIRDYIHIMDLINAHLLALEYLRAANKSDIFNLGNGMGFSVKEIIDASEKVTEQNIKKEIGPRRAGDPPILVASSDKIKKVLGWEPKHTDIKDIIQSAWNFHKNYNKGS